MVGATEKPTPEQVATVLLAIIGLGFIVIVAVALFAAVHKPLVITAL